MRHRTYSLPILQKTVTVATDLDKPFAQLSTPADTAIEVCGLHLGQFNSTTLVTTDGTFLVTMTQRSAATTLASSTTPVRIASSQDPVSKLTGSTTTNATGISGAGGTAVTIVRRFLVELQDPLRLSPILFEPFCLEPSEFVTLEIDDAASSPATLVLTGDWLFRELL